MTQAEGSKQILSAERGVRVWAPGRPRTKGSLKPTHAKLGGGRCRVGLREDGEYSVPWKNTMIAAIRRSCEVHRWPGPVEVNAVFRFERETQNADLQGQGGPADPWPTGHQYGDEDKLRRNLLDALTQSGLILDDALVVGGQNWKRFVRPDQLEVPGVTFVVMPADAATLPEWVEKKVMLG